MSSGQIAHATLFEFGYSRNIAVKGQTAKALLALVETGKVSCVGRRAQFPERLEDRIEGRQSGSGDLFSGR